jgi:hypothetical protein
MRNQNLLSCPVFALLAFISLFLQVSCTEKDPPGRILISFEHDCEGLNLEKDTMIYTNAAGNRYEVNELQYFISDFTLWKDGKPFKPVSDVNIHYVDIEVPSTLEWNPAKELPAGSYDSITFIFGLNEALNQSGLFVNPPERDMFWPDVMGGGYHYMKMNGKWLADDGVEKPFNLHLGIGMVTDGIGNETFIHNYIRICLPLSDCYLNGDIGYQKFVLEMHLNSWFDTPYTWNWNQTGGQIMQNQEAMHLASENGKDVFTVYFIKSTSR